MSTFLYLLYLAVFVVSQVEQEGEGSIPCICKTVVERSPLELILHEMKIEQFTERSIEKHRIWGCAIAIIKPIYT